MVLFLDVCVISDNDPDPVLNWWIKSLYLYESDKRIIDEGKELSDSIVNAAQSLLSKQFPQFAGFQNTVLGENLKFKSVARVKSVQILNSGKPADLR